MMLTRVTAGVEVGDESVAHIPGGEFRGAVVTRLPVIT